MSLHSYIGTYSSVWMLQFLRCLIGQKFISLLMTSSFPWYVRKFLLVKINIVKSRLLGG